MPLQLERRGQLVYAFIQELHNTIVAAVDIDLANPDRAGRFNMHRSVARGDRRAAHPSKAFTHALKKPRPVVLPLIAIVLANQIGDFFPISAVDRMKEMFRVQTDLLLRPPKPEQIYADAQGKG